MMTENQNKENRLGRSALIGENDPAFITSLKFNADGLIPAIVQDAGDNQVLMLAYMSRESLEISLQRRLCCFWSRSRQELWVKGESSGNYLHLLSMRCDCDRDTLLLSVHKDGPACHLGTITCFEDPDEPAIAKFSLESLAELLQGRKDAPQEGSYTSYLFAKGIDKILKKVGEESTEVILAAKGNDRRETVYELADLTYHLLVLMTEMGISLDEVRNELASRHIVDHKIKQEKMS